MQFFRVGIVNFFGILCPGVLLLIDVIIFVLEFDISLSQPLPLWFEGGGGVLLLGAFVVCYLFGFVLRLISPDRIDTLATVVARIVQPKHYFELRRLGREFLKNHETASRTWKQKEKSRRFRHHLTDRYKTVINKKQGNVPGFFWDEEKYPYYWGSRYLYTRHLPSMIADKLTSEAKYHNKDAYNTWKSIVAAENPDLAGRVDEAEAFVRFMSGSFWALLIGLFLGIVLIGTGLGCAPDRVHFGLFLSIVSGPMCGIIVWHFKRQRMREVKVLLDAIYALSSDSGEYLRLIGAPPPDHPAGFRAYMAINVRNTAARDAALRVLRQCPQLIEASETYGNCDLMAVLRVTEMSEIQSIVRKIQSVEGIASIQTFLGTSPPYFFKRTEGDEDI